MRSNFHWSTTHLFLLELHAFHFELTIPKDRLMKYKRNGGEARRGKKTSLNKRRPRSLRPAMPTKGHRAGATQTRSHSRSSSGTRTGANLQITQREGASTKSEKNKKTPHTQEVSVLFRARESPKPRSGASTVWAWILIY